MAAGLRTGYSNGKKAASSTSGKATSTGCKAAFHRQRCRSKCFTRPKCLIRISHHTAPNANSTG